MRGTAAKRIRKEVYGEDMSMKAKRYRWSDGSCYNMGLRRAYQQLKGWYKKLNRVGRAMANKPAVEVGTV